jgi:hypothetical protein
LLFAIPDHPWVDEGAGVRISMTIAELDNLPESLRTARFCELLREFDGETPEDSATNIEFITKNVGKIFSNLQTGVNISTAIPLKANQGLAFRGMTINGSGFILTEVEKEKFNSNSNSDNVIKPIWNGKDIAQIRRGAYVIDLYGLDTNDIQQEYPQIYQHIYNSVRLEREKCQVASLREKWWLFERSRPDLREAVENIQYFTVTTMTAKHRIVKCQLTCPMTTINLTD